MISEPMKDNKAKGFTLVELLVIIGILIALTLMALPAFRFFQKETALNSSVSEIVNTLRLARSKTLASEGDSQWGLYFSTTTVLQEYILFKGSDYQSRDDFFDETHQLPKSVEIFETQLGSEATSSVVFKRITGESIAFVGQSVSLRLKTDHAKTKTIYIESSGRVSLGVLPVFSDENRIKDSRHVHLDYIRFIATSTEDLILTFDGSFIEKIVIAENIRNYQIYWEREIDIGGETQKVKIHTHRLNSPDTQFSVHRDRRYNNKSLKIELSGDDSGFIVEYSADGLATTKTSIYASESDWQ